MIGDGDHAVLGEQLDDPGGVVRAEADRDGFVVDVDDPAVRDPQERCFVDVRVGCAFVV